MLRNYDFARQIYFAEKLEPESRTRGRAPEEPGAHGPNICIDENRHYEYIRTVTSGTSSACEVEPELFSCLPDAFFYDDVACKRGT